MKKLKENSITPEKDNNVKWSIRDKIINSGNIFFKERDKNNKPLLIFVLLILHSNIDSMKIHVNS